ncbi:MAG TPA: hypothetical protein VJP77_05870 [Planctomycetota bacterium]|nr:hypothetical protein [Planctomycetota bacterium]
MVGVPDFAAMPVYTPEPPAFFPPATTQPWVTSKDPIFNTHEFRPYPVKHCRHALGLPPEPTP